ncbi:MAG: amidase [Hyphomicrobiaceae bacterium]
MSASCEIAGLGVVDLAAAIAKGEVTSEAAVGAAIASAEAWQPHINAFISLDKAEALEKAQAADKARRKGTIRGPLGPLHGVPLAHKDMFWRAGKIMTGGSPILKDFRTTATATPIARLEAAGSITIGALNMCEFAASPTGRNPHVGDCGNPHDPARVTGGSSSGSGATVAAGIVPAALGSDTGGSIRIPAAICGVVGIKPTWSRVSNQGSIPRAFSLDCIGPLARHARDCALILSIIAGRDAGDATTADEPPPPPGLPELDPRALKIAVAAPESVSGVAPSIAASVATAAGAFKGLGATTVSRTLPDFGPLYSLGDTISKCEAAALHRRWMTERPNDYGRLTYDRTLAGFMLPATRYIEALMLRGRLTAEFIEETIADADALMLPTAAIETPTIAEVAAREKAGEILPVIAGFAALTRPINYLGLPSVSVPCGVDSRGMPVAFQLVGRPFSERKLLAIANLFEREIGFGVPRPRLP